MADGIDKGNLSSLICLILRKLLRPTKTCMDRLYAFDDEGSGQGCFWRVLSCYFVLLFKIVQKQKVLECIHIFAEV